MGLLTTIGMPQTPWFHVGKTMPLAPAMTGNGNGFSIPPAKKYGVFSWGMVQMALILPTGTQDLNLAEWGSAVDRLTNALWPWGMDISSATEISPRLVHRPPSDDLGQNVTNADVARFRCIPTTCFSCMF